MPALLTKSLGVVCPSCDFLNVVAAVRCMTCGVATDGVQAPAAPAPRVKAVQPQNLDASVQDTIPDAVVPAARPEASPVSSSPSSPALTIPSSSPSSDRVAAASSIHDAITAPGAGPPGLKRAAPQPLSAPPARPPFQTPTPAPAPVPAGPKFGLTVLAGPARGQRFRLSGGGAQIGRGKGIILFPDDPFISPLHATLSIRDGKLYVRDESSTSGVYVSITGTETIPAMGTFCCGLRLFRFLGSLEAAPPWNKQDVLIYGSAVPNGQTQYAVEEILLGERGGRCLLSPGPLITVGQDRCDFSYSNDEGLAPRHCEISPLPDGAMIRDLSGGLGTYVRIAGERLIKPGDRLRVGQQTLQVELFS